MPQRRRHVTSFTITARALLLSGVLLSGVLLSGVLLSSCGFFGKEQPAASSPTAPTVTETPAAPAGPAPFSPTTFEPMSVRAVVGRTPIIMYHDIIKKRGRGSVWFDCTKSEFEQQMQWLADQGATPVSLEDLHRHLVRGEPLPANAIVLTFDDNYQGFYDNAYPILKQRRWPAAMFVHTKFVGDTSGTHPKMSWDTLRQLDKEGLVTIASHTVSHPDDMATLPMDAQERELSDAKTMLEQQLGHPIPYFAYPNGKGDAKTFDAAQRLGYTMAFTIQNGPAEESPGIMAVNRYIHTRLEKAWQDAQDAQRNAPGEMVEVTLQKSPIALEVGEWAGVQMALVKGGAPSTLRAENGVRQSVGEFVRQANAQAGINGTFFVNAALRGTDNNLIGPSLTPSDAALIPDTAPYRLPRLINRPLVFWGADKLAIVPFQPGYMNAIEPLRQVVPETDNVLLGGAWIVHSGVARTAEELKPYAVSDFDQTRRRAFFGVTSSGEPVLGGTLEVVGTAKMAEAAAEAGVYEAVLLDSGFSTSIVYDNKIVVTGHTAPSLPSRPVPHAIVLTGDLAPPLSPETQEALDKAKPAVGEIPAAEAQESLPGPRRSRRRSR